MKRLVPEVPTIAWGLLFVVINTFVNIRGIELTAMLNRIALVGELLVLGIFLVMGIWWLATDPMSNGFTLKPFYNEETFSMPLVMGAVSLGCLSFMGFDAISTLSKEAKDAKKGPGHAMIGSLMLVGVLFMAQTYIAGCLCPDGSVFADDPDNGFYLVASIAGGKFLYGLCALATAIAWGFLGVFSFGGAVDIVECEAGACRLPVPNKTCSMDHFGPKKWVEMVRFARFGKKSPLWFEWGPFQLTGCLKFCATSFLCLRGVCCFRRWAA